MFISVVLLTISLLKLATLFSLIAFDSDTTRLLLTKAKISIFQQYKSIN